MTDGPRRNRSSTGIALMVLAMAVLPFLDVCAKYLGQRGVPVMQVVWARMFFGAFITLPFAMQAGGGLSVLKVQMPWFNTLRAVMLIAATACFFLSLKFQSIADSLAIFFVQPLVVTLLSPWILGESVGRRRWIAVLIGFIGTLIIIRPGFQTIGPGVPLALAAGCAIAVYGLMTRKMAGRIPAMVTTFHTSLIGAIIMSAAAFLYWIPPTPWIWTILVLLAFIAAIGHFLVVKSYDFAEASLLAPFAYTEMIMATIAGWWFFGDFPDGWTFLGVGILIACAIYVSYRERLKAEPLASDFEQP